MIDGYGQAIENLQATLEATKGAAEKPSLTGALKLSLIHIQMCIRDRDNTLQRMVDREAKRAEGMGVG